MIPPALEPALAHPPGELGAATYRAAILVDQAAFQLLDACGPYDPAGDRLAKVATFLASWPAVVAAVQDLAGQATASAPANDVDQVRACA